MNVVGDVPYSLALFQLGHFMGMSFKYMLINKDVELRASLPSTTSVHGRKKFGTPIPC